MTTMAQLPKDHPAIVAWEAYKATPNFANTQRWVATIHADGSLWAAFYEGFCASRPAPLPDGEVGELVSELRRQSEHSRLINRFFGALEERAAAALAVLSAERDALREALKECTDDLEGLIKNQYGGLPDAPRRYEREGE